MGAWLSSLWSYSDRPDPLTGLTEKQVKAVQSTFAAARRNPKALGVDLFLRLFDSHPEYQKMFPFASVPKEDLQNNKRFVAHATTVIYSLASIVDNLDDPECLIELLLRIGQNHARHNVQHKAFEDVKRVIVGMLQRRLGKDLTPFAEESWCKTLDAANSIIFKGLDQAKE